MSDAGPGTGPSPGPGGGELRRLTGDAGLVAIGQVVSYAYPLVSIPLLSRVLGIEQLGVLVTVLAVIQMLIIWTDFGFGFSALRRIALAETAAERQRVVAATITAKLLLWAAGSVVLMIIVLAAPTLRSHADLYLVGLLTAVGAVFYPMWFIQGIGQLKLLAMLTAGSRLIALVGLILTVRTADQIDLAVFWQYAPYVLSAIACWVMLTRRRQARLRFTGFGNVREALHNSFPLFVNLAGGQVIVNSSSILLSQLASYRQAGLFGPADRMANAVDGVLGSVQQAMMPRVAAAHTHPERPNHRRLILLGSVGAYVLSGLLLVVIAPWLVPWYLGSDFVDAIPVVQLMGVATMVSGLSTTVVLDLVAAGQARICSIVTAFSALWHLITASIGAYYFGAVGVAVAVCGTDLFTAAILSIVILLRRRSARRGPSTASNDHTGDAGDAASTGTDLSAGTDPKGTRP